MSWPEVQFQRTKWMGLYAILRGFKNCETQKITLNFTVSGKFPLNPMDLEQSSEPWNIDNSLNLIGPRAWPLNWGKLKGPKPRPSEQKKTTSFCGPPLKPGDTAYAEIAVCVGSQDFRFHSHFQRHIFWHDKSTGFTPFLCTFEHHNETNLWICLSYFITSMYSW